MERKTQAYRNQHRILERLATSVPADPNEVDATSSRHTLDSLRSIFSVHVKLQTGLLYPWMRAHAAPELREKAVMFALVSERTLQALCEFSDRWKTDAIAANPVEFSRSWQVIARQLQELLEAQDRELYPAIEAYATAR